MIQNSILESIGQTPLVKLRNITGGIEATVAAKVEYLNPGQSVNCLLYTSPSPRDQRGSRMPSSA